MKKVKKPAKKAAKPKASGDFRVHGVTEQRVIKYVLDYGGDEILLTAPEIEKNFKGFWAVRCDYSLNDRFANFDYFLEKKVRKFKGSETGGGTDFSGYNQGFEFKSLKNAKKFASYLSRLKKVTGISGPDFYVNEIKG